MQITQKEFEQAYKNLVKADSILSNITAQDKRMESKLAFSHLYKAQGDYEKAHKYFQQYSALRDSIFSIENLNRIFELEASVRSEEYDYEYKALLLECEELEKKNRFMNFVIIVMTSLVVLGVLTLIIQLNFVYYYLVETRDKKSRLILSTQQPKGKWNRRIFKRKKLLENSSNLKTDKWNELYDSSYSVGEKLKENIALFELVIKKYVSLLDKVEPGAGDGFIYLIEKLYTLLKKIKSADLSKIMTRKKCNINDIILQFKDMISVYLQEQDISLDLDLAEGNPAVNCNAEALDDLLLNLFINSCHSFGEKGEIKISTSVLGEKVIIKLRDNGKGISKDDLDKIWLSFFTTKEKGKGLGLAWVKKIIDEHNGNIEITSEVNVGTEALITLDRVYD